MPKLTLGPDTVEFVPLTHKKQKQVFEMVADGVAKVADVGNVVQNIINAWLKGGGEIPLQVFVDIVKTVPNLLTEVVAFGLGVEVEQLDNAKNTEFTAALEMFVAENDLANEWIKTKKVFSLFVVRPEQAKKEE